jgi:hypothetical protein
MGAPASNGTIPPGAHAFGYEAPDPGQLEHLFMNRSTCSIWQWLMRNLASLTMLGVALTTR